MYIFHDDDEWETVSSYRACTACNGDMSRCDGRCNGMSSWGLKRRNPSEVKRIKAERQRKHEDDILAEAELIRARRACT
jgi:hypothetical protein